MRECILLCACSESELLPQTPDLPADVFTSCLTTPIKVREPPGGLSPALGRPPG
jgi:regulator-associated protein of mTOR